MFFFKTTVCTYAGPSLVAQSVKNLPAMQETVCIIGDQGSIPGPESSLEEGNGNPLQYYFLENPMDRGACHGNLPETNSVFLAGLK